MSQRHRGPAPAPAVGPAEDGAATAELAVVLPILMAVTTGLVWLLSVGLAQVRTVDAAREVARSVARGDDASAAVKRGEQVAPEGVRFSIGTGNGVVTVSAAGRVSGPGGIFDHLPGAQITAKATALQEDS